MHLAANAPDLVNAWKLILLGFDMTLPANHAQPDIVFRALDYAHHHDMNATLTTPEFTVAVHEYFGEVFGVPLVGLPAPGIDLFMGHMDGISS